MAKTTRRHEPLGIQSAEYRSCQHPVRESARAARAIQPIAPGGSLTGRVGMISCLDQVCASIGLPAAKAAFSEGLPKNVILQSLKQAEGGNGYVARFYETEGRPAAVAWSGLPVKIRAKQLTNLTDSSQIPVATNAGKITFSIKPWQLVTVRMIPE